MQWSEYDHEYTGTVRETYRYAADGTLDRVHAAQSQLAFANGATQLDVGGLGAPMLRADLRHDLMGRLTQQIDYSASGDAVYNREV